MIRVHGYILHGPLWYFPFHLLPFFLNSKGPEGPGDFIPAVGANLQRGPKVKKKV
jgi:hypothetical protein